MIISHFKFQLSDQYFQYFHFLQFLNSENDLQYD